MKTIVRFLCCAGLLTGLASFASAAEMTMKGMISDSMCGTSHAKMMQMHKDMKTDHDCTVGCVKAGAKYVFVSDAGKVYQISNQEAADVMKNAGESVSITGDVKGDTITVSKLMMMKH
jgi:hypothetical protein